jgi:hypothetical protein
VVDAGDPCWREENRERDAALDQLCAARELVLPKGGQRSAVGSERGAEGGGDEHPFDREATVAREHPGGQQGGLAKASTGGVTSVDQGWGRA